MSDARVTTTDSSFSPAFETHHIDIAPFVESHIPSLDFPEDAVVDRLTKEEFASLVKHTVDFMGLAGQSYKYSIPAHLSGHTDRHSVLGSEAEGVLVGTGVLGRVLVRDTDRKAYHRLLGDFCQGVWTGQERGSRRRILKGAIRTGGVLGAVAAFLQLGTQKAAALCGTYCGYCYHENQGGCTCPPGNAGVPYLRNYYTCYNPNTRSCYSWCSSECICYF